MMPSPTVGEPTQTPTGQGRAARRRLPPANESLLGAYLSCAIIAGMAVAFSPNLWIFPVVAMVFYFVYGHGRAARGGYVLEFADSVYYLGFTLTLMALFGSLEPFQWGQRDPLDPDSVMHHFGLGLITTLLGVLGRTGLNMFYRTPTESLESIKRQITEEADDYLETLRVLNGRARDVLSGTLGELETTLRGEMESISASLASLGAGLHTLVERTAGMDIGKIEEAYARLAGAIEDASLALDEKARALRDSLAELPRELRGAGESSRDAVLGITAAVQTLRDQFEAIARALVLVEQGVREIRFDPGSVQQELDKLAHVVDKASAAIAAAGGGIAAGSDRVASALAGVAGSIAAVDLDPVRRAFADITGHLREVARIIEESAARPASEALRDLAASVRTVRKDLDDLDAVLDDIVEAVGLKLEKLE